METPHSARELSVHQRLEVYPRLAAWLGKITHGCLYLIVAAVPLFFLPFTSDILDFNKQTLIIVLSGIGLVTWLGQAVSLRQLNLSVSWGHLSVLLFVMGYALSAFFSQDRYLSVVGMPHQVEWALCSILAFAVMYLLLANTSQNRNTMQLLLCTFLGSSILVGGFGLVHLFGWRSSDGFNTVGTVNAWGIYMTLPLVLSTSLLTLWEVSLDQHPLVQKCMKIVLWGSWFMALIVAFVVDYWIIWTILLGGAVLLVLCMWFVRSRLSAPIRMAPGLMVTALSVCLLIFNVPVHVQIPTEVLPSASASWKIAGQTLQQRPWLGSGPGTWVFDYSAFRQVAVNSSPFWMNRFERGLSAALSLPAMIGLLGTALWLGVIGFGLVNGGLHLAREEKSEELRWFIPMLVTWMSAVGIAVLSNYTLSTHVGFWFLLGLLTAYTTKQRICWNGQTSLIRSAILTLFFLFVLAGAVSGIWLLGQRVVADVYAATAGRQFQPEGLLQPTINALETAAALNVYNDAYQRDVSQVYVLRVKQELEEAGDTNRTQRINELVAKAVAHATKAVELSPANVDNWAISALVLQSIAPFTRGADEESINMYQQASIREPSNPVFVTEIGKTYILHADAYQQLLQSKDEAVRQDAVQQNAQALDRATEALNRAIALKPDYAVAHYYLGLVYERQGHVKEATVKLEQVVRSDSKNVGVAFQLALLYLRSGEKDKALNVFEQLVAFDPSYSNARWYLASLYEDARRYDDAIAQVKKVKEQNPNNDEVNKRLAALILLRNMNGKPIIGPLLEPVKESVVNSH